MPVVLREPSVDTMMPSWRGICSEMFHMPAGACNNVCPSIVLRGPMCAADEAAAQAVSRRYSSAAAAFGGGGPPQGGAPPQAPPRQQRAYPEEQHYRSREPAGRRGGRYTEEEPPAGYYDGHGRARHSQHEYAGVHLSQMYHLQGGGCRAYDLEVGVTIFSGWIAGRLKYRKSVLLTRLSYKMCCKTGLDCGGWCF